MIDDLGIKMQEDKNVCDNQSYSLKGIRILDLSTQVPGPYCSMLLADLGAEVIKIENPDGGDYSRLLPYLFNGVNRNKKSIALNLKSAEAKTIFHKMAKGADIIIEGFRPGVSRKLGIDYETIKKINPQIIYCSITGYGQDGPYRDKPGHDLNYLGYSGLLSLEQDLNTFSRMPGIPVADIAGSMFAAVSILAAFINKGKTGVGQYIDVSMTDGVFSFISSSIPAGLQGQRDGGSLHIPHYGIFKTKDEKYITLGIIHEEHFWKKFCSIVDMGNLAELDLFHRLDKRDEIHDRIRQCFVLKTLDEWLVILDEADVPCGPAYNIEESYADPQVQCRGSVFEIDHPDQGRIKLRGFPVIFSESKTKRDIPPPALGMNTEEILKELGYTNGEISELIAKKIINQ